MSSVIISSLFTSVCFMPVSWYLSFVGRRQLAVSCVEFCIHGRSRTMVLVAIRKANKPWPCHQSYALWHHSLSIKRCAGCRCLFSIAFRGMCFNLWYACFAQSIFLKLHGQLVLCGIEQNLCGILTKWELMSSTFAWRETCCCLTIIFFLIHVIKDNSSNCITLQQPVQTLTRIKQGQKENICHYTNIKQNDQIEKFLHIWLFTHSKQIQINCIVSV